MAISKVFSNTPSRPVKSRISISSKASEMSRLGLVELLTRSLKTFRYLVQAA